jgi:hypothetical protein
LTDEELDEALKGIFDGFSLVDKEALYEAIKKQYRKYSPLENIALHRDNDDALAELRRKIMEKYT